MLVTNSYMTNKVCTDPQEFLLLLSTDTDSCARLSWQMVDGLLVPSERSTTDLTVI